MIGSSGTVSGISQGSDAAVIASGTASLQTGLALKPFVIVYRVSPLTYMIARLPS